MDTIMFEVQMDRWIQGYPQRKSLYKDDLKPFKNYNPKFIITNKSSAENMVIKQLILMIWQRRKKINKKQTI